MLLLFAAIMRIMFYSGHIFSDDSYYVKVASDFLNVGEVGYLGYPVMKNRIAHIFTTALSFRLFGINEIASIIIPFFCSLGSIFIVYNFALKLYDQNKNVALLSAFLMAILPTDIAFATIAFADVQASFCFYFSLYLFYIAIEKNKTGFVVLAGLLAVTALWFKSIVIFGFVLLLLLMFYGLFTRKFRIKYFIAYFFVIGVMLLIEAAINAFSFSDPLRRLHLMEMNYTFSWYDFYPQALGEGNEPGFISYLLFLFSNIKYLFLRRFYLFLPLVAIIPAIFNLVNGKHKLISYWYFGLILMFLFFSTSISAYRPISLEQSWYLFPLFIPVVLIVGEYISRFSVKTRIAVMSLLVIFSIFMNFEYRAYFDVEAKKEFKEYVSNIEGKQIFSDHHTKYGVELTREYRDVNNVKLLDKLKLYAKPGDLIVISKKKLDELKLQGFDYKFKDYVKTSKQIGKYGEFEVYKIISFP